MSREGRWAPDFRTPILIILAFFSVSHSDALSSMDKFWFLSPGVTYTKHGPGFEISGGRNGLGSGEFQLLGALFRYEPADHRTEVGLEAGIAIFLLEIGVAYSDREFGGFLAPDLCIPIKAPGNPGIVVNLFYRFFPSAVAASSLGASVKVAWMRL